MAASAIPEGGQTTVTFPGAIANKNPGCAVPTYTVAIASASPARLQILALTICR
jgi:hypothetical protein